jgi:protein-arginine kinase activator protein McsA
MLVPIHKITLFRMGKIAAKKLIESEENHTCLGCGVCGDNFVRGLCSACYQASRREIRKGTVSEDELIKSGKMRPIDESAIGRPPTNRMTKAIRSNE